MKITIKRAVAFAISLSMAMSVAVSPLNFLAYEFHLPTPEVTVPEIILDDEGEPIFNATPVPNPYWDPTDPDSDQWVSNPYWDPDDPESNQWVIVYLPHVFPGFESDEDGFLIFDEDGWPVLPPDWEWVYEYLLDEDGNKILDEDGNEIPIRTPFWVYSHIEVIHPDWPRPPQPPQLQPGGQVTEEGEIHCFPPLPPRPPATIFNVITTGNAGEVAIPSRVGATGIASMLIPANAISQALTAARLANLPPVVRVTPDTGAGNAEGMVALLASNALSSLVSANATLQISNDTFTLELAPAVLEELIARTSGGLRINITPQTALHAGPRAVLGGNPVFSFDVRGMATGAVGVLANEMTFSVAAEGTGLFVAHIVGNQVNEIPSVFANGVFTWNASHGGIFGIGSR